MWILGFFFAQNSPCCVSAMRGTYILVFFVIAQCLIDMWNGTAQLLTSAVNQCPDPLAGPSRDELPRRMTDRRKKVVCCSIFVIFHFSFSVAKERARSSKVLYIISPPTVLTNTCFPSYLSEISVPARDRVFKQALLPGTSSQP